LTATVVSSSQINLQWTDNSNSETGFRIERCEGSGCGGFSPLATVGANVKTYSNTGLKASTSYTYRVWAYNAGGDSAQSTPPVSATTLCSYSISPTSKSFAAAGGSQMVTVTITAGCTWTAVSNVPFWIVVRSPGSGLGNGSFTYDVVKNTGVRRTGTITVAGQTHTVTQAKK